MRPSACSQSGDEGLPAIKKSLRQWMVSGTVLQNKRVHFYHYGSGWYRMVGHFRGG